MLPDILKEIPDQGFLGNTTTKPPPPGHRTYSLAHRTDAQLRPPAAPTCMN